MKVLGLVAITVLAFLHTGSASLSKDFEEFQALIPVDKISALVSKYLLNDKEFQEIYRYMQTSEDVKEVGEAVAHMPEIQELVEWISQQFYDWNLNYRGRRSIKRDLGGYKAFVDEFMALFPLDQLIALGRKKIAEGGVFAEFYHKLQAMKPVFEKIEKLPAYIRYTTHLKELGVDVEVYNNIAKELLGWN